jgi:hypothetical protein
MSSGLASARRYAAPRVAVISSAKMVRAHLELRPRLLAALWLAMVTSGCASLAAPEEWMSGEMVGSGGNAAGSNAGGGGGAVTSSTAGGATSAGGSGGGPGTGGSGDECVAPAPDWSVYFSPTSKHCYGARTVAETEWELARLYCADEFAADLAVITDMAEQTEIRDYLNGFDPLLEFWIGLYRTQDAWMWAPNNAPLTGYFGWGMSQPSEDGVTVEDCVMLDGNLNWFWNNIECGLIKYALCERPPS